MSRKKSLSHRLDHLQKRSYTDSTSVIPETDGIFETDHADPDEDLSGGQTEKADLKDKRERKFRYLKRTAQVIMSLLCVYAAFLIYCVSVTVFASNDDGSAAPERMTVKELKAEEEFSKVYYFYETSRSIYEQILLLDYRLSQGVEDPLLIAPEYEGMLDTIDVLCIKTDAFHPDSGYGQVKSLMLSWLEDDAAVYLQNMAEAISHNDSESAGNALEDRERVYDDFLLMTQNMAVLGEQVKGVDLTKLYTWSPDNYLSEEIDGVVNE